jgi:hypothetical protein
VEESKGCIKKNPCSGDADGAGWDAWCKVHMCRRLTLHCIAFFLWTK